MLHGIIFHSVCTSLLTGKYLFSLQIRIDHGHNRFFIRIFADNYRHGLKPRKLTGSLSTVPCDDLISPTDPWPYDSRHEHSTLFYTLHSLFHLFVIKDSERMILKGMKVGKRNLCHSRIITADNIRKRIDLDLSCYGPAHPASTSFVRDWYASATRPFGSCS